jgi:F-type H+-transporting ATPase subunit alpha
VELLKQNQYIPFNITDQVISIYAGTKGILDDVDLAAVRQFEDGMLEYMKTMGKAVRDELEQKKALDADLEKKLEAAIRAFKSGFVAKKL